MTRPLHALILEDRPEDAELVVHELRRSGFEPDWRRVETESEYIASLDPSLDVILADLMLPQFDAMRALQRLQERRLDIPFVIVSGRIGEELAVALMKNGATDYVWKDRLRRLGSAVTGALEAKQLRVKALEAQEEVRRNEEKFRLFVEAAPDASVIADSTGRIVLLNQQAERLFGYSRDELISEPIEILLPEWPRDEHAENRHEFTNQVRALGMGAGRTILGRSKDGREFPVEVSLSSFRTAEGFFVVSGIRDITERKRFEAQILHAKKTAETANNAKDIFLAGMSHELRTPLNSIIGFTGTMLMKLPGPLTADQEDQLRTIEDSAKHLMSLLNDILDLAKIESGKIDLNREPVACRNVVCEVITTLKPLAESKGLRLGIRPETANLNVRTDRRALTQILLNLTSNAIKFTRTGSVLLSYSRQRVNGRGAIEIGVSDSGIGIRPEDQAKLFQPFGRIETASPDSTPSTGLGLHLSQKLAGLLGGRIRLSSEFGKGSTFTVTLTEDECERANTARRR